MLEETTHNVTTILEDRLDSFIQLPLQSSIARTVNLLYSVPISQVPQCILGKAAVASVDYLKDPSLSISYQSLLWKIRSMAAVLSKDISFVPHIGSALRSAPQQLIPHLFSSLTFFLSNHSPPNTPDPAAFLPIFSCIAHFFSTLPPHSNILPSLASLSTSLLVFISRIVPPDPSLSGHVSSSLQQLFTLSRSFHHPSRRSAINSLVTCSKQSFLIPFMLDCFDLVDIKSMLNSPSPFIRHSAVLLFENLLKFDPYIVKENSRLIEFFIIEAAKSIFMEHVSSIKFDCIRALSTFPLKGISPFVVDAMLAPVVAPPSKLVLPEALQFMNISLVQKSNHHVKKKQSKPPESIIFTKIDDETISRPFGHLFPTLTNLSSTSISGLVFDGINEQDFRVRIATCNLIYTLCVDYDFVLNLSFILLSQMFGDLNHLVRVEGLFYTRKLLVNYSIDSKLVSESVLMSTLKGAITCHHDRYQSIRNQSVLIVSRLQSLDPDMTLMITVLESLLTGPIQSKVHTAMITCVLIGFLRNSIDNLISQVSTYPKVLENIKLGFAVREMDNSLPKSTVLELFKIFETFVSQIDVSDIVWKFFSNLKCLLKFQKVKERQQEVTRYFLNYYESISVDRLCLDNFKSLENCITHTKHNLVSHGMSSIPQEFLILFNFYEVLVKFSKKLHSSDSNFSHRSLCKFVATSLLNLHHLITRVLFFFEINVESSTFFQELLYFYQVFCVLGVCCRWIDFAHDFANISKYLNNLGMFASVFPDFESSRPISEVDIDFATILSGFKFWLPDQSSDFVQIFKNYSFSDQSPVKISAYFNSDITFTKKIGAIIKLSCLFTPKFLSKLKYLNNLIPSKFVGISSQTSTSPLVLNARLYRHSQLISIDELTTMNCCDATVFNFEFSFPFSASQLTDQSSKFNFCLGLIPRHFNDLSKAFGCCISNFVSFNVRAVNVGQIRSLKEAKKRSEIKVKDRS
ncbi:hypothetical protein GEMRC1_004499 [Eukaryota sp. GEM-RC1]